MGAGKTSIFIVLLIFFTMVGCANATQVPYTIDDDKNVWLKLNMSGDPITVYFVNNTSGSYVTPNNIFQFYDGFDSETLNASMTAYRLGGTESSTVSVDSGNLTLAGEPDVVSSGSVVINYNFTNASEIIVSRSVTDPYYADIACGLLPVKGTGNTSATSYWHTGFSDGFIWQQSGWVDQLIPKVTSNISYNTSPDTLQYGVIAGTGTGTNTSIVYNVSYDSDGNYNISYTRVTPGNVLFTPTYDDTWQTVHPDVYYNESGLWGYKYWMVVTPYPYSGESFENPSLLASNDGIKWVVPAGVSNPIDPYPGTVDGFVYHNNDPDMFYNPDDGKLYIYWLDSKGNATEASPYNANINLRTFDGITVSDEINVSGISNQSLSPTFYLDDDDTLYCYAATFNGTDGKAFEKTPADSENLLKMYTSTDYINFTYVKDIHMHNIPFTYSLWHLNVEKYNGSLRFIGSLNARRTTGADATIYYGTSPTWGEDVTWGTSALLPHRPGEWDAALTYRGCSLSDSNGMTVYYSARGTDGRWYTGIARVDNNGTVTYPPSTARTYQLASYHNASLLSSEKQWMVSQGEYSNGFGGVSSIDYIAVRPIGHDPIYSIVDYGANSYKTITITPVDNDEVTDYPVKIPGGLIGVSSTSQQINFDTVAPWIMTPNTAFAYSNSNLTVTFTDLSTNTPTSWLWDFGDGTNSTEQNPIHIYSSEGSYTVNLTASNLAGSDTLLMSVIANSGYTTDIKNSFVSSWGNTVSMVGAIIVIALAGSMIMMFRGKKDLSEVMNDLPGIILIVVLLVTGAIIFGQF